MHMFPIKQFLSQGIHNSLACKMSQLALNWMSKEAALNRSNLLWARSNDVGKTTTLETSNQFERNSSGTVDLDVYLEKKVSDLKTW